MTSLTLSSSVRIQLKTRRSSYDAYVANDGGSPNVSATCVQMNRWAKSGALDRVFEQILRIGFRCTERHRPFQSTTTPFQPASANAESGTLQTRFGNSGGMNKKVVCKNIFLQVVGIIYRKIPQKHEKLFNRKREMRYISTSKKVLSFNLSLLLKEPLSCGILSFGHNGAHLKKKDGAR